MPSQMTGTQTFRAAVCIGAPNWKQYKYSTADE